MLDEGGGEGEGEEEGTTHTGNRFVGSGVDKITGEKWLDR